MYSDKLGKILEQLDRSKYVFFTGGNPKERAIEVLDKYNLVEEKDYHFNGNTILLYVTPAKLSYKMTGGRLQYPRDFSFRLEIGFKKSGSSIILDTVGYRGIVDNTVDAIYGTIKNIKSVSSVVKELKEKGDSWDKKDRSHSFGYDSMAIIASDSNLYDTEFVGRLSVMVSASNALIKELGGLNLQ